MKKVIKLTESDLIRIVKKVLKENKRMISEDSAPVDTGAGGKIGVSGGNLQFINPNGKKCTYEVWDKKNGGKINFSYLKLIPGTFYDDYEVYFKNKTGDHKNNVPKKLVNSMVADGFACRTEFEAELMGYGGYLKKVG